MLNDILIVLFGVIVVMSLGYSSHALVSKFLSLINCKKLCEDCVTDFMVRYCRSLNACGRVKGIPLDRLNRLASKMSIRCFACSVLIHIEKDLKHDNLYSVVFFDKKTRFTSIKRFCCLYQHTEDTNVFMFVP